MLVSKLFLVSVFKKNPNFGTFVALGLTLGFGTDGFNGFLVPVHSDLRWWHPESNGHLPVAEWSDSSRPEL